MGPTSQLRSGTIGGGVPLERQIVTWAAGVTAALAIGYVVLGNYLPSFPWSRKMDKDVVPGLYNRYGNDCFANCIVQSLAGVPSFREYLRERALKDEKAQLRLTRALMQLLAALNKPAHNGKGRTYSVEPVILALEFMYKTRISRNQQDSQEFLHLIHEALSLEDSTIKKSLPENTPSTFPPNPFEGELSTQIKCQRCNLLTPWKKEAFTELSVAVPAKWSCTLPECLNSLLTIDPIPDYACPLCTLRNTLASLELMPTKSASLLRITSRLRTIATEFSSGSSSTPISLDLDSIDLSSELEWKYIKVPAIKRTVISKAPRVLAIHLVRSMYERGYGAGRNSCEVTFDEDLTIPVDGESSEGAEEAIIDDEENIEKYRLVSLVTHKGYHDSGHYISYRRRRRERRKRRQSLSEKTEEVNVEDNAEGIVDDLPVGLGLEGEVMPVETVDSRTRWWEISDEVVVGVDRTQVLDKKKGVYILFYERTS